MRVAIIADLAPNGMPVGGVQRSTTTLVPGLIAAGIDVIVIAPDHEHDTVRKDDSYGFPVTRVPMLERMQVIRSYRPWIEACRKVLHDLEPDIVQGQGLLHNGAAAVAWSGCPRIVAAHGDPVADARRHYSRLSNTILVPLLRATATGVIREADVVTNVTPDWRVNCAVEPAHHVYIPNPVEDVFFDGPEPPAGSQRVLFFGLARRIKGFDLLVDAWPSVRKAVPEATLEVFGPTSKEAATFTQNVDMDALGIHVHGPVPKERVAQEMRAGGVLVVPSRYEVAPVVIAEAWAVGIPVVATDVGGVGAMARGAAALCALSSSDLSYALISVIQGRTPDDIISNARMRADRQRRDVVAGDSARLYTDTLAKKTEMDWL